MADWKAFSITVPGKDLLEPVRQILETLLVFLEVLKVILDTIKTFLVDFGNPVRALVEALISLIEELFLSLKASGFFGYFDVPNPIEDPNFDRISGGFEAFTTRFKQSLFDTKDFNRPQPRSGSTKGGFVLLCVDASDPFQLIRRIRQLMRFFGKDLTNPRYDAPINFQVGPVGASGDPILDVASVFLNQPISSIALTWTLPSTTETPDPGYTDAAVKLASEFVPPSFVIEKSVGVNPTAYNIDISDFSTPEATGLIEYGRPTSIDSSLGGRFATSEGVTVLRREVLRDTQGDPVIKFQQYLLVPTALDVMGNLGTFRYVDNDVIPGESYFYRVRAYSGSLAVDQGTRQLKSVPTDVSALDSGLAANSKTPCFAWPSEDAGDEVVMGIPTQILQVRVPEQIDFDVVESLFALYLTALSLDFHQTLPKVVAGTNLPPKFDANGVNVSPTPVTYVGRGLLAQSAGYLGGLTGDEALGVLAAFETAALATDYANKTQALPWQSYAFRHFAKRLAVATASVLIEAKAGTSFRDIMRGNLPRGAISDVTGLSGLTSLEEVVLKFVELQEPLDFASVNPVDAQAITRFREGYPSLKLRQNLIVAVSFLRSFSLGGVTPDWVSIVPLRDIIPWSGQFLYDLLDKIDALLAAYAGFMEEIKRFIDLLLRKIDAMERFIQLLVDILNFIESLSISAFVLAVPEVSGDATAWAQEIDNAGGDRPPSGPAGYSSGIGLAYVAPDVTAFKAAFALIFGV